MRSGWYFLIIFILLIAFVVLAATVGQVAEQQALTDFIHTSLFFLSVT